MFYSYYFLQVFLNVVRTSAPFFRIADSLVLEHPFGFIEGSWQIVSKALSRRGTSLYGRVSLVRVMMFFPLADCASDSPCRRSDTPAKTRAANRCTSLGLSTSCFSHRIVRLPPPILISILSLYSFASLILSRLHSTLPRFFISSFLNRSKPLPSATAV